jgi:hypothetical protein
MHRAEFWGEESRTIRVDHTVILHSQGAVTLIPEIDGKMTGPINLLALDSLSIFYNGATM